MIYIMIYLIYHARWSRSWSIWSIWLLVEDRFGPEGNRCSTRWMPRGFMVCFVLFSREQSCNPPSFRKSRRFRVRLCHWCRCVMCLLLLVKNLDTSVSSLQFAVFDVSDVFVVFWTRHFGFVAVIVVALWKIATFSVASLSLLILVGSVFML